MTKKVIEQVAAEKRRMLLAMGESKAKADREAREVLEAARRREQAEKARKR